MSVVTSDVVPPQAKCRGLIVFVHGYMDGPEVWERVTGRLADVDWSLDALALQPTLKHPASSQELLQLYAAQVLDFVAQKSPDKCCPVVLVGHSMGGQVVELAARELGRRLAAMVLITPAPLAGCPLPPAVMERFESRTGLTDVADIQDGKRKLAVSLDDGALDILARAALATGPSTALEQLRAWTGGHPAGESASVVEAPVLMVSTDDQFFTHAALVEAASRFRSAQVQRVAGAGHWPQLEQPDLLEQMLRLFLGRLEH